MAHEIFQVLFSCTGQFSSSSYSTNLTYINFLSFLLSCVKVRRLQLVLIFWDVMIKRINRQKSTSSCVLLRYCLPNYLVLLG